MVLARSGAAPTLDDQGADQAGVVFLRRGAAPTDPCCGTPRRSVVCGGWARCPRRRERAAGPIDRVLFKPGPGHRNQRRVLGRAVVLDFAEVPAFMKPAMFTCARAASWSAHILEQKRLGELVRPAALYAGPDARTPDTVEGWKDVNATSIRWP